MWCACDHHGVPADDLESESLPADDVGLLEGLTTTRSIRRYRDEPVPPDALRAMLFAASRAPSGSNRQPFRFLVLTDSAVARGQGAHRRRRATRVGGQARARRLRPWFGAVDDSPEGPHGPRDAGVRRRVRARPVLVLPCLVRYRDPTPTEGCVGVPGVSEPAARGARPRLRRGADALARTRRGRAARCSACPTTCSWPRRSRSADRPVVTVRCAAVRCRSSCSPTAGTSPRPGPSIRPAPSTPTRARRVRRERPPFRGRLVRRGARRISPSRRRLERAGARAARGPLAACSPSTPGARWSPGAPRSGRRRCP